MAKSLNSQTTAGVTDSPATERLISRKRGQCAPIYAAQEFSLLRIAQMIITNEFLLSGTTTGNAGWNAKQMKLLGVRWPLRKGWKERLIGKNIPDDVAKKFLELAGATAKWKRTPDFDSMESHFAAISVRT